MRNTIELVVRDEDSLQSEQCKTFFELNRSTQTPASSGLGLTLNERKTLLKHVQQNLVSEQATRYVTQRSICPACGCGYKVKEHSQIVYRSLFGRLKLANPRRYARCQCHHQPSIEKSFSSLVDMLDERSHPDLIWIETQLSAWLSFRHAAIVLQSLLLEDAVAVSSIKAKTRTIGQRLEAEWVTQTEAQFGHYFEIDQDELTEVPSQGLQVDAGYPQTIPKQDVLHRHRLAVVIARTFIAEGPLRCHAYIDHPEMLGTCRIQAFLKQDHLDDGLLLTLISDAGNDIQNALYIGNRPVKYVLDWFHIAMRYEHLLQTLRGLPEQEALNKEALVDAAEHSKWRLWHGQSDQAIHRLQTLEQTCTQHQLTKPLKVLTILLNYLQVNQDRLIHYAQQHRLGLPMSSSQAESAVSTVIAERMRWRMRWSQKDAQTFLQVRCAVLNDDLGKHFNRWYSGKVLPPANQNAFLNAD